ADAGGEGAEPKVVSGSCPCGARARRGEALPECERRAAEHQGGLLRLGDGGGLWPAQPPGGVPQETIRQSVRKSLNRIKSNVNTQQTRTCRRTGFTRGSSGGRCAETSVAGRGPGTVRAGRSRSLAPHPGHQTRSAAA